MIETAYLRLPVADVSRSLRFYVERLGVKLVGERRLDLGGGFRIELVLAEVSVHRLTLCVRGDFEETLATYENRGILFTRDEAKAARCVDPDGHQLRFVAES